MTRSTIGRREVPPRQANVRGLGTEGATSMRSKCTDCGTQTNSSKSGLCRLCWNADRRVPNRQRFYSHVGTPAPGGCRYWLAGHDRDGYGVFTWKYANGVQRQFRAHHAALMLSGSVIPSDREVRHTCDTPACVEISHLKIDTHVANIADKVEKNRQAKGMTHGMVVLTEADVIEMRRRRTETGDSYATLGAAFGVDPTHAWRIVTRKAWSHIP